MVPAFPWLQGKTGEARGPLGEGLAGRRGKVTTSRRLALGKPTSHICPTFLRSQRKCGGILSWLQAGPGAASAPPWHLYFPCNNPETPPQAERVWFLHHRSLPLSNTFAFHLPSLWKGQKCKVKGQTWGWGLEVCLVGLIMRVLRHLPPGEVKGLLCPRSPIRDCPSGFRSGPITLEAVTVTSPYPALSA